MALHKKLDDELNRLRGDGDLAFDFWHSGGRQYKGNRPLDPKAVSEFEGLVLLCLKQIMDDQKRIKSHLVIY